MPTINIDILTFLHLSHGKINIINAVKINIINVVKKRDTNFKTLPGSYLKWKMCII